MFVVVVAAIVVALAVRAGDVTVPVRFVVVALLETVPLDVVPRCVAVDTPVVDLAIVLEAVRAVVLVCAVLRAEAFVTVALRLTVLPVPSRELAVGVRFVTCCDSGMLVVLFLAIVVLATTVEPVSFSVCC